MEQQSDRPWGRIFMGDRIADLSEVERVRSQRWTEQDENNYLETVCRKAEVRAREILAAAGEESRVLRTTAQEEGYAEGMKQAERELAELRDSMGKASHAVLSAIQEQSPALLRQWKADLTALLLLAVEKSVGIVLREDRAVILEAVLAQAAQILENGRNIVVHCNPEDSAAVEDIIGQGRERFPDLSAWKVRPDAKVPPGDILAESENSLAGSNLESRRKAVRKALEGLSLPDTA